MNYNKELNNDDKDNDNDLFDTIYKKTKNKELNKIKTYNTIYKKCKTKIKWASDNEQYTILFELPKFSFDCPLYNLEECANYIKNKLKNKFVVHHFTPQHLYQLHKLNNKDIDINNLTHTLYISWEYIKKKLHKIYN